MKSVKKSKKVKDRNKGEFHHNVPEFLLKNFRGSDGQVSIFDIRYSPLRLVGHSTGRFAGEYNSNFLSSGSRKIEDEFGRIETRIAPVINGLVGGKHFINKGDDAIALQDFMLSLAGRSRRLKRAPTEAESDFFDILKKYPSPMTEDFRTAQDASVILSSTFPTFVRQVSKLLLGELSRFTVMTLSVSESNRRRFVLSDRGPVDFMFPIYMSFLCVGIDENMIVDNMVAALKSEHSYSTNIDLFMPISPTKGLMLLGPVSTNLMSLVQVNDTTKFDRDTLAKSKPLLGLHRDLDDEEVHFLNKLSVGKSLQCVLANRTYRSEISDAMNLASFPTLIKYGAAKGDIAYPDQKEMFTVFLDCP